jgi:mannose-1-phosphate guanylyltransferase
MSGGRGRRFWPVSRASKPKQLVELAGGRTLLELTVERLTPVFDPDHILVITQERQLAETRKVLGRFEGLKVLAEPVGRNTAACIAFAATYIRAIHGDSVFAVLPADHFIGREDEFREVLLAGMDFVAERNALLTIGIKPDQPATGFGYIKRGKAAAEVEGLAFYEVSQFAEKPPLELAEKYIASGDYLWNAGIFIFKTSTILGEIERFLPGMAAEFKDCEKTIGTPGQAARIELCYSRVQEISIDFGVMEKTASAYVVPADIGWDDVGSWESFSRHMEKDADGTAVRGRHVSIGSRDCIIYSNSLTVATAGLKDTTIVVSEDAVLVIRREKGEEVKDIVDLIEREGLTGLL